MQNQQNLMPRQEYPMPRQQCLMPRQEHPETKQETHLPRQEHPETKQETHLLRQEWHLLTQQCTFDRQMPNSCEFLMDGNAFFPDPPISVSVNSAFGKDINTLDLLCGIVQSVINLPANANSSVYKWQMSADPFTEKSWTDAGEGSLAAFEITGLAPVTRYWFRVALITGNEQGEFSDPVTFVVS